MGSADFKLDSAERLSWYHVACFLHDHMDSSSLIMVLPWIIKKESRFKATWNQQFFFSSLNRQKKMEELIKQPAPECRKVYFLVGGRGGGMPLDLPLGPFVTWHSAMF